MKRAYIVSMCLLFILLIAGCSTQDQSLLIRVADHTNGSSHLREITNENEIMKINEITEYTIWVDYIISTAGEEDYQFWLEEKGNQERITNFDIWFDNNGAVIFDKKEGKYGEINAKDAEELLIILKD